MTPFEIHRGDGPVVLAQPHGGTFIPTEICSRLNENGRELSDTDWHIGRLYEGLLPTATTVRSNIHRYVIDVNRDPGGVSLYPGQNTTGLCPTTDFDGRDIWQDGQAPSADEIDARRSAYHTPYHAALASELARVADLHGVAVLYDCHSIRSEILYLFKGILPIFSIGTNGGSTAAAALETAVLDTCQANRHYDTVLNGRFKGGWTTRHYGDPNRGIHAVQMELAQRSYMDEAAPWAYREDRAKQLRSALANLLKSIDTIAQSGALII